MNKIVEYLSDYLLSKNIVKFSKIEDSFFLYKKLDKKLKLTPEIIRLNYLKESPYKLEESSISSVISDNNLYLWFHRNAGIRYLPEAILVYRQLLKKHSSIICIIRGKKDKVLMIKEGRLLSSFSKNSIKESDIFLIKDEYLIKDVLIIEEDEYAGFLKKSYKFLTLNDLLNILNIQIDFKSLMNRTIKWIALPLLISSVLIIMAMGIYQFYVDSEKEKLQVIHSNNKSVTSTIKENIDSNENENIRFNHLINEFKFYDKTIAISSIFKVTRDMNMTMHYIKVYDDKVDFVIRTNNQDDIPLYVKTLFTSQYFKDVKNLSSFKLRDKRLQTTMSATLKER